MACRAAKPPSVISSLPVMSFDWSPARNRMSLAMSSAAGLVNDEGMRPAGRGVCGEVLMKPLVNARLESEGWMHNTARTGSQPRKR